MMSGARTVAVIAVAVAMAAACSSSGESTSTTAVPAAVTEPRTTVVSTTVTDPPTTTTEEPTTTTAEATTTTAEATTTAAPTGSLQACEGFLTLDDPDADGWGECVVTLEDAGEQYFIVSGKINVTMEGFGTTIQASECPAFLVSIQTFVDDLKAAQWPAEVTPQLEELIAANEYELFVMDENCRGDSALIAQADSRQSAAVFEFRSALGVGTDF